MVERLKWSVRLRPGSPHDGLASRPEVGVASFHPAPPPGVVAAADAGEGDEDGGGNFFPTPGWEGPPRAVIHARRASSFGLGMSRPMSAPARGAGAGLMAPLPRTATTAPEPGRRVERTGAGSVSHGGGPARPGIVPRRRHRLPGLSCSCSGDRFEVFSDGDETVFRCVGCRCDWQVVLGHMALMPPRG